jgi:hypothetical protein
LLAAAAADGATYREDFHGQANLEETLRSATPLQKRTAEMGGARLERATSYL